MSLLPIKLYGEHATPNPCKVRIVLEELGLPFEDVLVTTSQVKEKAYTDINPNGRIPAIHDPNTDLTLWESGPILNYLCEQYDIDQKLSFTSFPEKHYVNQWIAYQISGQGPYYGQFIWFSFVHPEKFDSAIARYQKEILRVRGVLNTHLAKQASQSTNSDSWLVGDKMTIADLAWVMWEHISDFALAVKGAKPAAGEYPAYDAWMQKLYARPTVQKAIEGRRRGMTKSGIIERLKAKAQQDGMRSVSIAAIEEYGL